MACTTRGSCYLCNQPGHWSRACPMAICRFCGENGHSTVACKLAAMRTSIEDAASFDDLFFACHISVPDVGAMKKKVEQLVKPFKKCGMIDEVDLVDALAACSLNPNDDGHLRVLGYILARYLEVTHPKIKAFLRMVEPWKVRDILGVTAFEKNGATHYRKRTGFCV